MKKYIFRDDKKRDIAIGKLVCLARTYKKHAQEMNSELPKEPLLFFKPTSSVIFNGDTIKIPGVSKCIHHEVELGIIIGRKCKNITKKDPIGTYFITFLDKSIALDSSIIIANKNNTAIAPIYIVTNSKAKNSHSKIINKNDEDKKQLTKNNNEKTG